MRTPKTARFFVAFSVVFTTVSTASAGLVSASVSTLREYAQPLLLTSTANRITLESDGSNINEGFGPTLVATDVVVLTDRKVVMSTTSELVMLNEDGTLDIGFGNQGTVSGFTNITHIAVDESANRVYVLDVPSNGTTTITALSLTGYNKGTTNATGITAITAGNSALVALTSTGTNSLVFDLNLGTTRTLNFDNDVKDFSAISDATGWSLNGIDGIAIADREGGFVRRLWVQGLETTGPATASAHPSAVPTTDIEFEVPTHLSADNAGNLYVSTGGTQAGSVLRLAPDGQSTASVLISNLPEILIVAVAPTAEEPIVVNDPAQDAAASIGVQAITTGETSKFKIESLTVSTTNRTVVDVGGYTGDDRGGIGLSSTKVFIRGDAYLGAFNKSDLGGPTANSATNPNDAMVSDLKTMTLYGFDYGTGTNTFTKLTALDSGGQIPASPTVINLSTAIPYSGGEIYSGYGRVVYRNSNGRVYDIDLPSGTVYDRGSVTLTRYPSENWASWGVAEFFDGELWLTVAASNATDIVRYKVSDGTSQVVVTSTGFGDMSRFIVDPTSQRWYFYSEVGSAALNFPYGENLGFAPAVITTTPAVSITPSVTPTNANSISFDVTFGEAVTGVAASDFSLGGTSTGWSITGLTANSSTNYTLNVAQTGDGDGTLNATLLANSVNWTAGSMTIPDTNTVSTNATIDNTAPSVATISGASGAQNLTQFSFTTTMNESVTGLSGSDFSLPGINGCTFTTSASSGTSFVVTATGCEASGATAITLAANAVTDLAGNTGPSSAYTTNLTSAPPTISVPTAVPVDTGLFVTLADRATPISVSNLGAATVNVVVTASAGNIRLGTTTNLNAIAGYASANWTGNSSTTIGFNGNQSAINTALASLQFKGITAASTPSISVQVNSGTTAVLYSPATNRYYERVTSTLTWTQAQSAAASRTFNGRTGYLAVVTSAAENSFLVNTLGSGNVNGTWFGASDSASEGVWRWATGPEASTQFWSGAGAGSAVGGAYTNWYSNEPNDSGSNEDCGLYATNNQWNDGNCAGTTTSYFVEYGGLTADAPSEINISGTATTFVAAPPPTVTGVPARPVSSTSVTATFVGSGAAGATFECKLDSGAWTSCTSPVTYSSLSAGSHTLQTREIVSATNGSPSTNTWIVDPIIGPPVATLTTTSSITNSSSLSYSLTFSEDITGLADADFSNAGTATGCSFAVSGDQPGTTFSVNVTGCSSGTVIAQLAGNSVTDSAGITGPLTPHTFTAGTQTTGLSGPYGAALTPDGTRLLTANNSGNTVRVYNTSSNALVASIAVGTNPRAIVVTGDGTRAYASNFSSNTVSVISTATWTVTATITVGTNPWGMVLSPDDSRLFVANGNGTVSAINTLTNVATTVISGLTNAVDVDISPDGTKLYVLRQSNQIIGQYNANTYALVANTSATGYTMYSMAISPDGARIYVPYHLASGTGSLGIVTTSNMSLTSVSGLTQAVEVVVTRDGTRVIATQNTPSGSLRVFNTVTNSFTSLNPAVGSYPWETVINSSGTMAYTMNNSSSSYTPITLVSGAQSSSVTIDTSAPTASFSTTPSSPTNSSSATYTITFSEAISGLASSDFTFSGTAIGCSATPAAASGSSINVSVSGCTTGGSIVLTLGANSVSDAAGNTGPTSSVSSTSINYDVVVGAPTATFSANPTSPTKATTLEFTLTFSEPVSGLLASEITNSGTATGCVVAISGTQPTTTFAVTVTSCSAGTVQLKVAAGAVNDNAGVTGPGGSGGSVNTVETTLTGVSSTIYSTVTPDGTKLLVPAGGSNYVKVYSLPAYTLLATVAVGSTPYAVAVSPDNSTAYVANYSGASVSVIRLSDYTVTSTISVGSLPIGLAINPAGTRLYVSNYSSGNISVVNTATNTVLTTITAATPWQITMNSAGTRAYVGGLGGVVHVLDLTTNTLSTSISVGGSIYELGLNRAGTRLYAANYGSSQVHVINTSTNSNIANITGVTNAMGIVTSLDDSIAYVANYSGSSVTMINTTTNALITPAISVGVNPRGISATPDGTRIFVSNTSSASVSVISTSGGVISNSITIDRTPPTATFSALPNSSLTTSGTYTLTFSEAISGLTSSDFINTGTATDCVFTPASATGTAINVVVSGCSAGTLRARLNANSVSDTALNAGPTTALTAASSSSVDPIPGAPVATWTTTPVTPTKADQFGFGLTFNESITGLEAGDISNAGTALNCVFTVAGSQPGTSFTVTASSCGDGTVKLKIAPQSVADLSGTTGPGGSGTPNTVASTITGMNNVLGSAVTPDGSRLYVANNGYSTVTVVNTATRAIVTTIAVGSNPRTVAMTPDGKRAYVTNYGSNTVSVISTTTNTVTSTISGFSSPQGIVISPDGSKLYVGNIGANSVSVVSTTLNSIIATVALGRAPWGLAINATGTRVYTGNYNNSTVSVIATSNNSLAATITVGTSPYEVVVSRSGSFVYVANYSSGTVSVINASTNTVTNTISGFTSPMAITTSIDDSTLYVGQYGYSTLKTVNLSTNTVNAGTIAVGTNPRTFTMTVDGSLLYLNNYAGSNDITVINGIASSQSSVVTVDRSGATATWGTPAAGSTTFPLTFNETVSGISASDFSNLGTSSGCVFTPSASTAPSGVAINVVVTNCSTGTLRIRLAADSVADAVGNTGPSAVLDSSSTGVDGVPGGPKASWSVPTSPFISGQNITATLTFNEPVIGLSASDITVSGTSTGCEIAISGTSPGTTYTVTASSCSEGRVALVLSPSSVTDEALNAGPGTSVTANTVIRTISSLSSAYYSVMSHDGSKIYVANTNANEIRVFSNSTGSAVAAISVGASPRGIAISPKGDLIAVANYSGNSVSIINTSTNTVAGTITGFGTGPMGVAWAPNGRTVWVSNVSTNTVASLDASSFSVNSSGIATGAYPNAVAVSPDGSRVYTANVNSNTVTVINAVLNTVVSTINVGSQPYHLAITPNGSRVVVANYGSSSSSIINTSTNAVTTTVSGLSSPMGVAITPDGSRAYFANRGNYTVRAIDLTPSTPTLLVSPSISLASQAPWGLSMSSDGSTLVAMFDSGNRLMTIETGLVQSRVYSIDRTVPTVTAFTTNNTALNDLNEQSWSITFSEDITGLTANDFVLSGTSTGWGTPVLTGSGSSYVVTTTHATPSSGTVALTLNADSVIDTAGNSGPSTTSQGTTVTFAPSEGVFKIDSLLTTGSSNLEVGSYTGDDKGGIALTSSQVLLSGDTNIARFGLASLSSPSVVAANNQTWMDAIASDLKTMRAYAFNLNTARTGSFTTLTALDATTGLPTSNVITLSSAIPVTGSSRALFSGYGRVVVATNGRIYDVSVPGGIVTDRGAMTPPPRSMSESWATWGVAEYFGGRLYLTYVRSSTSIERARVPDGAKTIINTFSGLSDMASFVVNPRNNRWYYHYEGNATSFGFGSDETIGYANATINLGGTTPNSVTDLAASTRSTTALLTWSAPTTGPTPTDYLVEYSVDGGTSWTWVNDGVSTTTNASIPSLTPGAMATFRVTTVANMNAAPPVTTDPSLVSPYAAAPTISSITTGNTQLSVNFSAPTVVGASAITNYQYSLDGGTNWVTRSPASTSTPLTITGLTNGNSYDISLRAVNNSGNGDASVVTTAIPSTIATAPTITSITPSASQTLSIAFNAPSSNGGNNITNFQYSLNGGVSWTTRSPVAVTSPLVITGLSNGSSYSVVIRAVNINGGGVSSNAVTAIPGIPPSAPTITSTSTSDATFSVVFAAPASNGSIAITNYEYSLDGTNWITRSPASTSSPLVISDLTNGTSYTVRIRAVNPAGPGTASSSTTGIPSRVADAPTITTIEPSSGRLRVSYSPPAFDGGNAITNYQYSINDGSTWTALSPISTSGSFSITGLTNARTYPVRVRAVNIRGAGAASAAVNGIPATTPGAPTINAISPSNGQLSVAFTAGADGGAAPTNYEYSIDDGSTWLTRSPASTASPIIISSLTNGQTYPVRIRSVNSQGAGGSSAASDGTPATTPGAPTIDSITPGNNRLSVNITAGATGGAVITNYEYSTDNGVSWTTRTPASTSNPIFITGLTNGTAYQVRVRAVNSQGSGIASSATTARPATTPGAPVIDGIAGDPGQITVTFSAPASDGGSTITNYEYSTDGGTTWTTRSPVSTTSPLTISNLIDGTVYSVKLRGVNAQGSGTGSATVEGTPVNTPGAPTISKIISGSGFLKIDFSAAPARGSTVTNYEYSLDNGTSWITLDPAATTSPITVNNLTNGTTYPIKIRGVNGRGSGLESSAVNGVPSAPPAAPTITGIQVGNISGSLSVSFTAGNNGGAVISDTEYSVDGGTSWTSAATSTSPLNIIGLTNGTTYSVKLRSVNVRGAGAASSAMSGTPIWSPGAPSLTSVSGGNQELTLYFAAPTVTGGSTITNYAYSTNGGDTWITRSPASISRPLTISNLANGTAYNVMVRAINAYGNGAPSNSIGAKPATVPGAPSIDSITGTNTSLTIAFTAPADDGGEAVSSYEYSIDSGQTWRTRSPLSSATPLVISGLTNATDYTVKLRAVNVQGPGAESTGSIGRPAGAPSAPSISGITSMNGGLSVAFVAGSDNGAAITNVEFSSDNGVTWTTRSPASSSSPLEITDLTNGTSYPVKVRLVNSQGSGIASAATNATPATVPSAPTIDSISPLDGALSVIVSDGDTGGATVTSYKYSTNNGVTWTATPTNSQTFNIPSLLNGSTYAVKVRAVNRMGDGEPSSPASGTPSRAPYAPTITSISPGNGRLTIAFTEGSTGGSPTTTLRYSLDGGTSWTARSSTSTASPLVVSNLTNGTSYDVKIQMVNARGNGDPSLPSSGTPSTVPGIPSISSITSANRALTVAVTAPSSNGGTDITNYEYSLDNGSTWASESTAVSTGSFTISTLTNGTQYSVKIRAINARGPSTASSATTATPSTTPSMPVIRSVTPGNQLVELDFALGPNGGAPITNIQYSINDGASWTTRSPASLTTPLTITGLDNGVTYPIRVRAVNINGPGTSSRSSGTPATVASAPTVTRIIPGNGTLTVEFESPEDNGGAGITNYAYSIDGGALTPLSPSRVDSPFTISDLTNGTEYSIEVVAINSQGNGAPSTAVLQSPATTPGAPTLSSPTVSDQTLTLNFYVVDDGGRAITSVDYSVDGGDSWTSVPGSSSPITVTGLSNGTTYDVKLRARNAIGQGTPSATRQLTPASPPLAPTINDISRADGELTVNFTSGGSGGTEITNFEYSTDGGDNWTTPDPAITTSPITISGLTNATTYAVKVRGVNAQGAGVASASMNGTPATVPNAPTISSITRADSAASVAFTLGSSNGDTITNIQYSINGGLTWITRNPSSTTSPLALSSLVNGNRYAVQVRAVNSMGEGSASTSTFVVPATTPSAPTITAATGENGRAVVSFEPNGNGGDAITNYAYSSDNGANWTTLSPATTTGPIIITGLSNGTSYAIRLKAINSVGESSASTAVSALPSGPPSAPTITTIISSDSSLLVDFVDGFNGGAPILSYQVSTNAGRTWTPVVGTNNPMVIPGLINGVAYPVSIRAVNSRGPGTASSVESGTPATVPDAPQITQVISASGSVDVAFSFAGDGGAAITNIAYSIDNGDTWTTRSPASTSGPLTLSGLTNGTTYPVKIRAINVRGSGEPSVAVNALPATTPSAPTLNGVTSGNGALNVSFAAPTDNGGAPILNYQYSLDGGDNWTSTPESSSPIEINDVTIGTEYDIAIRAVNLRGPGTSSNASTKRATAPPTAPFITSLVEGNGEITLRYAPPTDSGGDTLQDYYYTIDGGVTWEPTSSAQSSDDLMSVGILSTVNEVRLGQLTNGESYSIGLRASNSDVLGVPSQSILAIPSTVPTVIRNLTVNSTDGEVSIAWEDPAFDGGLEIAGYEYTLDNGTSWNDVVENPTVIRGLVNGSTYRIKVRARNANGPGPSSALALATPMTVPRATGIPVATAGQLSADLTWTAPKDFGGSPITDYVIEYSTNNGATWSLVNDGINSSTSVTISKLVAGTAYTFRVTAVNSVGAGEPSVSSNAVTPTAPPPAPVIDTPSLETPTLSPVTPPSSGSNKTPTKKISLQPQETPVATPKVEPGASPEPAEKPSTEIVTPQVSPSDNSKVPTGVFVFFVLLVLFSAAGITLTLLKKTR